MASERAEAALLTEFRRIADADGRVWVLRRQGTKIWVGRSALALVEADALTAKYALQAWGSLAG